MLELERIDNMELNIDPQAAVELLEIYYHLEQDLKRQVPIQYIIYLESIKDKNYEFSLDESKELLENTFKEETIEIIKYIFENILNNE